MEQFIKFTNISKYMAAIQAANALRTATYAAVIALSVFHAFKVYRAMVK